MALSIELAGEFTIPCVCMECHQVYKRLTAGRLVKQGEASHGYCPTCLPRVEESWFGKPVTA